MEVIKAKLKAGASPDFIIYPKRKGAVLHVAWTKVTKAGVAELQKALPKCNINSGF